MNSRDNYLTSICRLHTAYRVLPALCTAGLVVSFIGSALIAEKVAYGQPRTVAAPLPPIELAMTVGEARNLPLPPETSWGIADKEVVTATEVSNALILNAKKEGSTFLLFKRNNGTEQRYEISVTSMQIGRVVDEVTKLLDGTPGVRVRRVGARLFIEGGVTTEADAKRIAQIANVYAGQVVNLCVVGQPAAERKLLIRIDFFFVQYEKTSSYAVGIGWPAAIGGAGAGGPASVGAVTSTFDFDLLAKTTTAAKASIVGQPLPRLDIASRNGWARVLKQSTVITGNGSEAKFSSGGEQNFPQNQGLSVGLVKVKFGTDISVLPRYDATTKDVEVHVGADIADLTPTEGTVPGRALTTLDTTVTMKLGQALVLSGIKTLSTRNNIDGLPGLSEIPVVGLLFGSHQRADVETEGAVFVVPSIVDQVPKSSLEVIRNAMSTYRQFAGDMRNLETFPNLPPQAK
jgi:pilus assembly protein CpaC